MNVKLICFASAGDEIFRRLGIRRCGEERDKDGVTGGFVCLAEGALLHDLSELSG